MQEQLLPELDPVRPWVSSSSREPPWRASRWACAASAPTTFKTRAPTSTNTRTHRTCCQERTGTRTRPELKQHIPRPDDPAKAGAQWNRALLNRGFPDVRMLRRINERTGSSAGVADFVGMLASSLARLVGQCGRSASCRCGCCGRFGGWCSVNSCVTAGNVAATGRGCGPCVLGGISKADWPAVAD